MISEKRDRRNNMPLLFFVRGGYDLSRLLF